jgi:hypothetical protein
MKVTALIPDDLVAEVRDLAKGKNLTESLITALKEWARIQKLRALTERVRGAPLAFTKGYSARAVRSLSRT